MREQMQIDLKDAMRSRDAPRVDVLRRALALIGNAEAADELAARAEILAAYL